MENQALYTHFESLSPVLYKTNLIFVLIYCAFHICSLHDKECNIKRCLQQNRFPLQLVVLTLELFFRIKNLLVAISPLRIVCLVTYALLLITSLCVVAARLLTMAQHHAILLFSVEIISGLIKMVTA